MGGDLVFVADVHLVENDPELPAFHAFLRSLAGNATTCVIVGDLFNVWIATPRFLSGDQVRLLDVLREVAARGVTFKFVEGNRDYFVARHWTGDPFAEVATRELVETIGPRRLLVTHGDLVNTEDRPYRVWRAVTRSWAVRAALALTPSGTGRRLADGMERKLRGTNRRHKSTLPRDRLEACGRRAVAAGHDGVVMGHFHQEMEIEVPGGRVWILPDWRADRRYLRFSPDGTGRFVAYEGQEPAA